MYLNRTNNYLCISEIATIVRNEMEFNGLSSMNIQTQFVGKVGDHKIRVGVVITIRYQERRSAIFPTIQVCSRSCMTKKL